MEFFADLHVHIGSAKGRPVKITASRRLNIINIIKTCIEEKGINIVGIIDCASRPVIEEIQEYIDKSHLIELENGGLSYQGKLTIILGAEVETTEQEGAAHSLAFFPYINQIKIFSQIMSRYITNIDLSSQKARISAAELLNIVQELQGILIPAHVFTPYKSFYGSCYDRLSLAFGKNFRKIPAIELGLSADTDFADTIAELSDKTFLSNSDAHSLEKIGREYNKLILKSGDFKNLSEALYSNSEENKIVANYGLNPKLGKYHRTLCLDCNYIAEGNPPVTRCSNCRSQKIVMGVLDRIVLIADYNKPIHPTQRPPYKYQIPLEFIPGIGTKTLKKLISAFGSEMNVLHKADFKELSNVIGEKCAKNIVMGRKGELKLKSGGGGVYGRISK